MKAKYWKLPGLVLALTLALAFAPSSAKAENTAAFTCYLIVEENARVPAVTFTYTIAPGTAEPSATPLSMRASAVRLSEAPSLPTAKPPPVPKRRETTSRWLRAKNTQRNRW